MYSINNDECRDHRIMRLLSLRSNKVKIVENIRSRKVFLFQEILKEYGGNCKAIGIFFWGGGEAIKSRIKRRI